MKNELLALGYTNDSRVGTSGLEKQYEDILKATNSSYSIKYNSNGDSIVTNSINGQKEITFVCQLIGNFKHSQMNLLRMN